MERKEKKHYSAPELLLRQYQGEDVISCSDPPVIQKARKLYSGEAIDDMEIDIFN